MTTVNAGVRPASPLFGAQANNGDRKLNPEPPPVPPNPSGSRVKNFFAKIGRGLGVTGKFMINEGTFGDTALGGKGLRRGLQVTSTAAGAAAGGYGGYKAGDLIIDKTTWFDKATSKTQTMFKTATTAVGSFTGAIGMNQLVGFILKKAKG